MGVCAHSSAEGMKSFVIFAIDEGNNSTVFEDWMAEHAIGFKVLHGVYKGSAETSYIVNTDNFVRIRAGGFVANQESFLYLTAMQKDGCRRAFLRYQNNDVVEELGKFYETTREYAQKCENSTYDLSSNTYWITEKHTKVNTKDIASAVV